MGLAVLNPMGSVALQEKNLLIFATCLILVVVIPTIIMVLVFAFKYRAGNKNAKYSPEWCHNNLLEAVWWGIPIVIIIILGTVTWKTTQKLDPYRPLDSDKEHIIIEVVALDWKWLFIYPEYHFGTVNYIKIPLNVPIKFKITADAPMNSFMIPELGGQIYAMQGMETKIHMVANEIGQFQGFSANYSGHGFSGMKFIAESVTEEDFAKWVKEMQVLKNPLNIERYNQELFPQTSSEPVKYYNPVDATLYRHIIDKFMMTHGGGHHQMHNMHKENSQEHNKHGN
jgi:cytochrome o ubiquinol oxidase subunit 2